MRLPFLPARPKCQLVVASYPQGCTVNYKALLVFDSQIVKLGTTKRFWAMAAPMFHIFADPGRGYYVAGQVQPVLYFDWPAMPDGGIKNGQP